MNLSNPDSALGLPGCLGQRSQQTAQHGSHVVAPVEAELHLGEVAVAVLGELDGVVRAGQRGLDSDTPTVLAIRACNWLRWRNSTISNALAGSMARGDQASEADQWEPGSWRAPGCKPRECAHPRTRVRLAPACRAIGAPKSCLSAMSASGRQRQFTAPSDCRHSGNGHPRRTSAWWRACEFTHLAISCHSPVPALRQSSSVPRPASDRHIVLDVFVLGDEHHASLGVEIHQPRVTTPGDHGLEGLLGVVVG